MRMPKTLADKRGQALVIIAAAMVAVVAIAAVALDGGHAYMQRRLMQNAADAAALAGAWDLVEGGDEVSCQALVREYAETRNGADALEDDDIDCGISAPNEVVVTTTKTVSTWFAGLIGRPQVTVRARAVAGIYLGEGCVTAPIALFMGKIEEAPPDACLAIFDSDKEVGDVYEDYIEVAGANRAWLGLDCKFPKKCSPDAPSVQLWMREGPDFTIDVPGKYMGDPGSMTVAVREARVGWSYVIPVYNRVWRYTSQNRCQESWPDNDICMVRAPGYDYVPPYEPPGGGDPIDQDDSYCEDSLDVPTPPEVYPPDYPARCEEDCCCTTEAADIDPTDPYAEIGDQNYCYELDPLLVYEYTTDSSLSGQYYYNIIDLVCFKVNKVIDTGPVKEILGCLSNTCVAECLEGDPWPPGDDGPVVVKLID